MAFDEDMNEDTDEIPDLRPLLFPLSPPSFCEYMDFVSSFFLCRFLSLSVLQCGFLNPSSTSAFAAILSVPASLLFFNIPKDTPAYVCDGRFSEGG